MNFIEYEFVYIYSAAVELGETADEDVGEFFLCLRVVGEVFGRGVFIGFAELFEFFEDAPKGVVVGADTACLAAIDCARIAAGG